MVQMEDEIASIGAVLGSFFAGKRAMTATSGPGFALMTELITHGVMSETPAVIINAQRGGPYTGLPTKTEQSDLHAAVFGGPGDSARIVIAPSNVLECYRYTLRSFQLAEKYQTPVIVLSDFFLNNRVEKREAFPRPRRMNERTGMFTPKHEKGAVQEISYDRIGHFPTGCSRGGKGFFSMPRDSNTRNGGKPDYSSEIHMKMTEKRHRKIHGALADLPPPGVLGRGGIWTLVSSPGGPPSVRRSRPC
jgi:2-oxoglutarate/2-oxoacid ferredoxin oxidoreductase subunit alpha